MKTLLQAEEVQMRTVVAPSCTQPLRTSIEAGSSPMKTVINHGGSLSTITHIALSEMPEPPNDGSIYGRRNKQWIPITSSGAAISTDPDNRAVTGSDGGVYVSDDLNPDPLAYYMIARG